jgi:hypothetical protein
MAQKNVYTLYSLFYMPKCVHIFLGHSVCVSTIKPVGKLHVREVKELKETQNDNNSV